MNSFETLAEKHEIYEIVAQFNDYINELNRITGLDGALDKNGLKMRSFEERFQEDPINDAEEILALAKDHPEKIERINQVAEFMNIIVDKGIYSPEDITNFKRAHNEVQRLIQGEKSHYYFNDPEFHPDLLEMKEDPYGKVGSFGDYVNELNKVVDLEGNPDFKEPMLSFQERYMDRGEIKDTKKILSLIEDHPQKVARINEVVAYMNKLTSQSFHSVEDLANIKKAYNEIQRLVQGFDIKRRFREEDADPNNLNLELAEA